MFLLYIHANAVNNNKGNTSSGEQTSGLSMEFSIKVHVLYGSHRYEHFLRPSDPTFGSF